MWNLRPESLTKSILLFPSNPFFMIRQIRLINPRNRQIHPALNHLGLSSQRSNKGTVISLINRDTVLVLKCTSHLLSHLTHLCASSSSTRPKTLSLLQIRLEHTMWGTVCRVLSLKPLSFVYSCLCTNDMFYVLRPNQTFCFQLSQKCPVQCTQWKNPNRFRDWMENPPANQTLLRIV